MKYRLVIGTLCASAALSCGCTFFRDVDSVEFREAEDTGGESDAGPTDAGDAGMGDGGIDAADTGPDAETDLGDADTTDADTTDAGDMMDMPDFGPCGPPVDHTSPTDFGNVQDNSCNPVDPPVQCRNDPSLRCLILLDLSEDPPVFTADCGTSSGWGPLMEGEACGTAANNEKCRPGLMCINWGAVESRDPRPHGCATLCEMSDDGGCAADQFCSWQFPELDGVGICTDACDPYDSENTCPAGSICAPDFFYPDMARLPKFRCRLDDEDPMVAPSMPGQPCSLGSRDRTYRYCQDDAICYPLEPGENNPQATCVRPCQNDQDCAGLGGYECPECGEGPWELRFCQPSM